MTISSEGPTIPPNDLFEEELRCPECGGKVRAEAGDALTCVECARAYPIVRGVPRMLTASMRRALEGEGASRTVEKEKAATAQSFGYEWSKFSTLHKEYEENFLGYHAPRGPEFFRGKRVLDAGCGMGRIAAALQARGHRVVGVDLDPALLAQAAATYPGLELLAERVESLSPDRLAEAGHPRAYDLVVCVGNVMILGAPDTERAMLAAMRDLLAPQGRILVGFHTFVALEHAREYAPDEFARDCAAVGLRVEARYAGYDLRPFDPAGDYAVHILSRTPTHE